MNFLAMWINLNLSKITADDTLVLANNRQVLAFKNTWAAQKNNRVLPKALSWGQYLQQTWRQIAPDTHQRLISTLEVRMLVRQSMRQCGQAVDNRLLDEVIKNLDYCYAHLIDVQKLSQSPLQNCAYFSAWIVHYQQRKRQLGLIDSNDLPSAILQHSRQVRSPYVYGFKTLTPLQSQLFTALNYQSLNAENANKNSHNRTFKTSDDEIFSAAKWAKNLHQHAPQKSIAIISPTLNQDYYQITSIFDAVFNNTLVATGEKSYNVSLGLPLLDYPLIQHLLAVLKLSQQLQNNLINTDTFNAVIRSPYSAHAQNEAHHRALLVNQILALSQTNFKLEKIEPLLANTPHLKKILDAISTQPKNAQQSLEQWLLDFDQCLIDWGFTADRTLSSVEYQLFSKYQQMRLQLNSWAGICKHLNASQALLQLQDWLLPIIFQAQSAKTPIQILGALEAEGLYFDEAWVLDMTDDFLPATLNSPRFIPTHIAIEHQIPHSSLDLITQDAGNTLNNLYNLSAKVIFSYAKMHFENEQHHSPMLAFDAPIAQQTRQYQPVSLSTLKDTQTRPADDLSVSSGVKLLQDQTACAFKGFAHRLNITHFDAPHIGLNAAQQGNILHNILANLFTIFPTRTLLSDCTDAALNALIDAEIERGLSPYTPSGFRQVERQRLTQIIQKFLTLEKQRDEFSVIACEQKMPANVNGLRFNTRLDRMDKMENGDCIIFDYKTGKLPGNPWCGAIIKEAQLPIYALNNAIDGVAFMQITADKISLTGLANNAESLPYKYKKQQKCDEWHQQLKIWKMQLNQASSDYQQGKAQVLPSKGACQYCKISSLCRVQK